MRGIFITGTDTDVGKTYVATLLAEQLVKNGIRVIPRKPVESGCQNNNGELIPEDASALKQAAAYAGDLSDICRFRFEAALSPVRAARMENQTVTIAQLQQACKHCGNGFLLVEGAGGFYSPLASDGLNADLAVAIQLPVLLVANDRLGCINQILLTAEAISNRGLKLAAVILNAKDQPSNLDMNNAKDLHDLIDTPIYTLAHTQNNEVPIKDLARYLQSQ
ncbi:MAG: dethiobiotin synthase [Gammaproteobacteria bacterium]|nr:dethiobiotin synthase [Gammaproteobacteria bacterium]MCW8922005.1 dethiobiotin synthase [Gammaproteobacteria bacterium]